MQLADALAANRTLTELRLGNVRFWHDAAAVAAIMRAVTGHPHLKALSLRKNSSPDPAAAGAALGALVAANAPALEVVAVSGSLQLGDAGLGPLFEALRSNTHIRELRCCNTGVREAFARDALLPAV